MRFLAVARPRRIHRELNRPVLRGLWYIDKVVLRVFRALGEYAVLNFLRKRLERVYILPVGYIPQFRPRIGIGQEVAILIGKENPAHIPARQCCRIAQGDIGILAGSDIVRALKGQCRGSVAILPRAMLDAGGERTLDDMTPKQLEDELGTRVSFADSMGQVLRVMRRCAAS